MYPDSSASLILIQLIPLLFFDIYLFIGLGEPPRSIKAIEPNFAVFHPSLNLGNLNLGTLKSLYNEP